MNESKDVLQDSHEKGNKKIKKTAFRQMYKANILLIFFPKIDPSVDCIIDDEDIMMFGPASLKRKERFAVDWCL